MMQRLIFSPSSRQDLLEIFDFIARDKPIAASNWIDLIEEKCKLVAETPEFAISETMEGTEFVRRFMLHIVPRGLARTKYCGLFQHRGGNTRSDPMRSPITPKGSKPVAGG